MFGRNDQINKEKTMLYRQCKHKFVKVAVTGAIICMICELLIEPTKHDHLPEVDRNPQSYAASEVTINISTAYNPQSGFYRGF